MKKSICTVSAIVLLFLLLLQPQLSFEGASQGLLLWFHTVLPTLLPFMLCSNLIVLLDGVPLLTRPLRPFLRYVLGLSPSGGYVLIAGLLCGYPMGAKTCSEFLTQKWISRNEARYLLAICNHPSPMFLLGYVASKLSFEIPMGQVLLALYLPLLFLSWAARHLYLRDRSTCCLPETEKNPLPEHTQTFDELMISSFEVMVRIGGYIMIFSILAVFVKKFSCLPVPFRAFLLGIVEITTGIQMLSLDTAGPLQGLLMVLVIAFGGVSGIFQTRSVLIDAKNAGLSIRHYLLWKLLHALLSGITYLVLLTI